MAEYPDETIVIESREDLIEACHAYPYSSDYDVRCDPHDLFDFEVVDNGGDMSFEERYLGTQLGSRVDYGRHESMTDEELIEEEIDGLFAFTQLLGFMDDDKERVADTIVIVRKRNGRAKAAAFDD